MLRLHVELNDRLIVGLAGRHTNASHTVALKPRKGPLEDVLSAVTPPLSVKNTISVFSSCFNSRTLARTTPTASGGSVMPAYERRLHCREQQGREHADDGDHREKFHGTLPCPGN